MRILKNKIALTLTVAICCIALFASFIALTSFTNRATANNLTSMGSTFDLAPDDSDVNVAAFDTSISNNQVEGTVFLNSITDNIDQYIKETKLQQEALALQQARRASEANAQKPESGNPENRSETNEGQPQPEAAPEPVKSQGANLNGYEQQVLAIINNIRAGHGLAPLAPSQALTNIARSRSADMLSRNYFSHYTPEGTNLFDLLRGNGIGYANAGENLAHSMPASAGSPHVFADAWMNSPGHRDNILRGVYNQIGIGIAENGGRRVVTTVFTN